MSNDSTGSFNPFEQDNGGAEEKVSFLKNLDVFNEETRARLEKSQNFPRTANPTVLTRAEESRGNGENEVLALIAKNSANLSQKYRSGIRSARVISGQILLQAPAGFFSRYDDVLKRAVGFVQGFFSSQAELDAINLAKKNPTNDDLQEGAFTAVMRGCAEFFETSGINVSPLERQIVSQFVYNEIAGFSVLDPLWHDRRFTEIICNGPNDVQVEMEGRIVKVPSVKFRDAKHLQNLIDRLYEAINRTVSPVRPIRQGRLPDNSRMMAVHTTVAPEGPNFNIRRHPEEYWTPQDLLNLGVGSEELLTFLGNLIRKGVNIIVSGGTGTGKTSTLAGLVGFIPNDTRIVTLEQNLELKISPLKNCAKAMEANLDIDENGREIGVSMRDLVEATTQMRPEALICGEIKDKSAYDLLTLLNSGASKGGMTTLHANNAEACIKKLINLSAQAGDMSEKALLPQIAESIDFVVQVERASDGSRRIVQVVEVLPRQVLDEAGELTLGLNPIWVFGDRKIVKTKSGEIRHTGKWKKVGEVSRERRILKNLDLEENLSWEALSKEGEIPGAMTVTQAFERNKQLGKI